MTTCTFGVNLDLSIGPKVFELARQVEQWGFDGIWARDHVSFGHPLPDPLTLLTGFAAVTSHIELGTGIYILPLRHPTLAAKMTATVDHLCGGRFSFGVGIGGEFPKEWEGCGVPLAQRVSRCEEAIEVVRRLWTEDHVAHQGKLFEFSDVTIAPKPARAGGPPILIGGRTEAAQRRAARLGDGWLPYILDPPRIREGMERVRSFADEAGRDPSRLTLVHSLMLRIDADYENAARWVAERVGRRWNIDYEKPARRYSVLGTPAQCAEQLAAYIDAGADHVIIEPMCDADAVGDLLQAIAQEVLPKVRSASS